MSSVVYKNTERGVALVVSLIFLLVITIMAVVAATNSKQGLTMTSNLQDSYESFQAAEAGVMAAIATAGTGSATDKFTGNQYEDDIFDEFDDDEGPLGHLTDGSSKVTVDIFLTNFDGSCPRSRTEAYSVKEFSCDYYRVEASHEVKRKATTRVAQGVIKTTISAN